MKPSSDRPSAPLREPSAAEEAALAWVARCDRGLDVAQAAEFAAWLAADPAHERLFAEFQGTWAMLAPEARGVAAPRRARLAAWLASGLAAAAAIAIGYTAWWRPAHFSTAPGTAVGEVRELRLPDGSQLTLDTDSAVSVGFSPAERRIRLTRGQAHFEVAKNPVRPFVVEAGGVAVRAVGTAFEVRLADAAVEVLVTEGQVAVAGATPGAAEVAVAAGQRLVLSTELGRSPAAPPPVAVVVEADAVRRELAWRERRLEFVAAPLAEIVAEFNRYNRRQLAVADAALAAERFGGAFRADDPAGLVRMLRENFGVAAEESGGRTVLRAAREK